VAHKPDKVFFMRFSWGDRRQSAYTCARQISKFLTDLAAIDPAFRPWEVFDSVKNDFDGNLKYVGLGSRHIPVVPSNLLKSLLKGRFKTDAYAGQPHRCIMHDLGFMIWFRASRADAQIHCGASSRNMCMIGLPSIGKVGQKILRLPMLTRIAKVAIENWSPDIGIVTSPACNEIMCRDQVRKHAGWITYVADSFEKPVPAPSGATVKKFHRGRLIFATNQRFSSENPKHMRVVRELTDSLQPLNPPLPNPQPSKHQIARKRR